MFGNPLVQFGVGFRIFVNVHGEVSGVFRNLLVQFEVSAWIFVNVHGDVSGVFGNPLVQFGVGTRIFIKSMMMFLVCSATRLSSLEWMLGYSSIPW